MLQNISGDIVMLKTKPKMPHPGHDQHLCYLVNIGFVRTNPRDFKTLVKDARFVCKNCGRVAYDRGNLCNPVKL